MTAGEAERRRLERDLHDGAQQRLLALGLGLARARSTARGPAAETPRAAEVRVAAIRDELREIAHGIHSVTLAEGGLAEAVLALVQAAGGGVTVDALPERRFPAAAEAAVYRLVAASLALEGAAGVRIAIQARRASWTPRSACRRRARRALGGRGPRRGAGVRRRRVAHR